MPPSIPVSVFRLFPRPTATVLSIAALGAVLLAVPAASHAQYYVRPYRPHARVIAIYPKGMYIGAGAVGVRVLGQHGDNALLDHGGGLTFHAGFRVSRSLALEAGWMGSLHDADRVGAAFGGADLLVLNGFTGDAKIFFRTATEGVEPFIQGGVGLYLLGDAVLGAQSLGTGFQAGGGFDVKLGRHFTLGMRALYRGLSMGSPQQARSNTYVHTLTAEGVLGFRF